MLPAPTCPTPHQYWLGDLSHISTFTTSDVAIPHIACNVETPALKPSTIFFMSAQGMKGTASFWKSHWAEICTHCYTSSCMKAPTNTFCITLMQQNASRPPLVRYHKSLSCQNYSKYHKQITRASHSWTSPSQEQPPYPVTLTKSCTAQQQAYSPQWEIASYLHHFPTIMSHNPHHAQPHP